MDFESKKSKDTSLESSKKEVIDRGGNFNKTSSDLAMERAEFMEESAKSEESDAKAIAELNKKYDMPPSPAVAEKLAEADEIKAKEAALLSSIEENSDLTTAEGRQTEINATESDYEKMVREVDSKPETLEERNQRVINESESDYEKVVKEVDSIPETLEEKNQKIINATESDYEKTVREVDSQPKTQAEKNDEEMAKFFGKEETTAVKNYDKDGNEIIDINNENREADLAKEIAGAQNYEELYAAFQKGSEFTSSYDNKTKFSGQDMIDRVEDLRNVMSKNVGSMQKNFDDPSFLSYANEHGAKDKIIELLKKDMENSGAEEEAALAGELELSDKIKSEQEFAADAVEKPVAEKPQEGEKKWNDVQSEALSDFVKGLKEKKSSKETKTKWEGDMIMQGMEDFINSQKEKTPVTETLKDMFSFIRKKGAEINKGRMAAQDAIGEFSKKSAEWSKKMFGGAEIGKSREASKIDRIMSGDNRSDEAIKIDEAMGRAFEDKDGKIEAMGNKLKLAETPGELIGSLDGIDGLEGSQGMYRTEDQKKYIQYLFNSGNENYLRFITRTGGLRENVQRVFDGEKSHKENLKQAA